MNISSNENYFSKLAVFVVIAALLIFNFQFYGKQLRENKPLRLLSWDVFGYYLYLPATFIYSDPGIKNEVWINTIKTKYDVSPVLYQVAGGSRGKKRIVYQCGLSYFFAPGFFMAHIVAHPLGCANDGFSAPYQWSVFITSLLVTFLGLFYLRKLLLHFFNDAITSICIVLICFGSNWFLTAGYMHGMPHSFLFTLNVLILFFTKRWSDSHERKYAILTAVALAWAYNCRPTEFAWILIPLFWNVKSLNDLKLKWKNVPVFKSNLIAFVITFIVITLPQLAYMQYASNDILKVNLHTEKLSLFDPYALQFLFSYKKGWLLYTPIMLFAIAGFISLFKTNRNIFYALFFFFIINLWITSSWENWWYGASYGQRPMVETYALMAIPFGCLLQHILKRNFMISISFFVLLAATFVLSVFQSRQFYIGIIHNERMTKAYYWKVFGKLRTDAETFNLLEPERVNSEFKNDVADFEIKHLINYDFEKNHSFPGAYINTNESFCLQLDTSMKRSNFFEAEHISLTDKKYFWIKGSIKLFLTEDADTSNSVFIINTEAYKHRSIKQSEYKLNSEDYKSGEWNTLNFDYITPIFFHNDDLIKIAFEYRGNSKIYIDNLQADVWIPKEDY